MMRHIRKRLRDSRAVNKPSASPPVPGKLDRGIETFESCEGGPGHAYPEPTICFSGGPEAGWRALGICLTHALPVLCLRRVWYVLDANEPTGPRWEITFRERVL
jgi:hypothetical protein